ncbi:MAG: hypothetical protein A2X86_06935 [Bdellovibrionales bacterium GWA2_49_15]|nr:MAG: hypothetical protein A2X86_06935 [Bdellovibrionales bacterium GWA2_49_15]HAZ11990.1 hypothetical protein [Bdellovibrionales bacterium]
MNTQLGLTLQNYLNIEYKKLFNILKREVSFQILLVVSSFCVLLLFAYPSNPNNVTVIGLFITATKVIVTFILYKQLVSKYLKKSISYYTLFACFFTPGVIYGPLLLLYFSFLKLYLGYYENQSTQLLFSFSNINFKAFSLGATVHFFYTVVEVLFITVVLSSNFKGKIFGNFIAIPKALFKDLLIMAGLLFTFDFALNVVYGIFSNLLGDTPSAGLIAAGVQMVKLFFDLAIPVTLTKRYLNDIPA